MNKYIILMLAALVLSACSMNEVSNLEQKNASEHASIIKAIKQYQQEDSLQVALLKRDIVLYRQALQKAISDLEIAQLRQAQANSGPSLTNATNESNLIKQQALQVREQKLDDVSALLSSYVSDSLITSPKKLNSISYEKQIAEIEKELFEIRSSLIENDVSHIITAESKSQKPVESQPVAEVKPNVKAKQVAVDSPEARAEYDEAKVLYDSSDYDTAIILFKAFLKKYPAHELAANAQYWLGESYYSNKNYLKAIIEFENVTWKYPKSGKAPDAQFKLGLSYLNQGDKAKARQELQKVKQQYPAYERMNQVDSYLSGIK